MISPTPGLPRTFSPIVLYVSNSDSPKTSPRTGQKRKRNEEDTNTDKIVKCMRCALNIPFIQGQDPICNECKKPPRRSRGRKQAPNRVVPYVSSIIFPLDSQVSTEEKVKRVYKQGKCKMCGEETSPCWRRDRFNRQVCNACGLEDRKQRMDDKVAEVIKKYGRAVCEICEKNNWSRFVKGRIICGTCDPRSPTREEMRRRSMRQRMSLDFVVN